MKPTSTNDLLKSGNSNPGRGAYLRGEAMESLDDDLETVEPKEFNVSCCRSYATPRGRCYSCPEDDLQEEKDI